MSDKVDYHTIMGCVCSAQDLMPLGECLLRKCPLKQNNMKSGVELIAEERQKQIDKYGFTCKHHRDNPQWYDNDQLQFAATTLLMHEIDEQVDVPMLVPAGWDKDWFEDLNTRSRKERLIIAGALIAAELDRIQA